MDLNEFEREMLIPQMRDRAAYMRETFIRIRDIAADPETAYRIAPEFRKIAPDDAPGAEGDSTKSYLTKIRRQIDEAFVTPLTKLLDDHQNVSSLREMYRFFNEIRYLSDVVMNSENILFRYKSKMTFSAVDKVSGKRISQDQEWAIILTPFELALGELKRIAETTVESIEHWTKKEDEAKKPFLDYVAAVNNAATSRRTIYLQMSAMVLALSFSAFFLTARDPLGLKRENIHLKAEIEDAKGESARLAAEVQKLQEELRARHAQPVP
ncbi:hypothetical protein [Myxococcus stipitatus]|uniref:hypothetical protein n=1 Tax=Myxococcus stipitatus TaxID=83455 RepID=UPI001184AE81|nr:hypothetical protein [Myxococcus stipitatus]